MPCYSNIQTVLIDLKTIEASAQALGMTVTKKTANRYTLSKGREYIDIQRGADGKFETVAYSGSAYWPREVMDPLVIQYAKDRTKALLKSKGYVPSQGQNTNELVFTSYR